MHVTAAVERNTSPATAAAPAPAPVAPPPVPPAPPTPPAPATPPAHGTAVEPPRRVPPPQPISTPNLRIAEPADVLRFMFSVGIECSYSTTEGNIRGNQMRETGHY